MQESVSSFREIYISGRFDFLSEKLRGIRRLGAKSLADAQWICLIPKYTMESALILGAGLLVGYQFL